MDGRTDVATGAHGDAPAGGHVTDRAWYGPPKYGGGGHIDPRDPARYYYSSGLQGMEFKLDWEDDANMPPRAIYWRRERVPGRAPDAAIYKNGRQYMVNNFFGPAYFAAGDVDVFLCDEQKDIVRRIAHVGRPPREDDTELLGACLDEHPALRQWLEETAWVGHWKGRFIIWSDLNRDGIPEPDELQFINFRNHPGRWNLPGMTLAMMKQLRMMSVFLDGVEVLGHQLQGDSILNQRFPDGSATSPSWRLSSIVSAAVRWTTIHGIRGGCRVTPCFRPFRVICRATRPAWRGMSCGWPGRESLRRRAGGSPDRPTRGGSGRPGR